jgi:hypothetical protein
MADTNFTSGTVIASSWLNDVNDLVYKGLLPDASLADPISEVSVLNWIPESEWATILNGTSTYDSTAAMNSAMAAAKVVRIPGKINITSQLVVPSTCDAIIGNNPYTCYFNKQFNGDLLKADNSGFKLISVGIEGNGATYTGGGVRPRGYNILIAHCRINDTADSSIIVEPAIGSNALAATYLRVDSCFLNPTTPSTTYAIRSTGVDDSTRPTCRVFSNLSGGSSLVDFSGMNYAVLTDSLGTALKFDANSGKIVMRGNRLTTSGIDITILGVDHIIDGNFFGVSAGKNVIIDAACINVDFGPTNKIAIGSSNFGTVVDNRATTIGNPNPNTVYDTLSTFAFTWTASVTNPTLGNSTSYGYYNRAGRRCWATFGLIRGSTATIGSGDYSFQLPFEAWVTATGVARIKSSTGTYHSATVIVQGGSSLATMYIDSQTAQFGSASITFSTGAQIDASIEYLISPT